MKFFIDQHGCAKNQVDGELIINLLKKKDWVQTFEPTEADLIVVNSCGFIESAKTESINAVMSARQMYPKAKILLAGCLAERYANDLKDELLEADGFFGNGDLSQIYKVIEPLMKDERPVLVPEQKGVCCGDRDLLLSFPGTAFVKITEGCNNRCSFCAIPIIRGNLRSRKAADIIEEIKLLVSKGVYEINLIGQDLAAYGTGADDNCFGDGRTFLPNGTPGSQILTQMDADERRLNDDGNNIRVNLCESASNSESGLARLIKMISEIEGTFAVRLLYIHPDHFNEDILPVMKADSRFLHYFDIPFQSGDDEIIKAMNRVGSHQKYKALIAKIRETFPDAAIRTTFLAGFPGESESSFENTKTFLNETATDWSGCFAYSKEDDTPAYSFKKQVPHKTAEKRASELVEIQAEITRERLKTRCGQEYDILIEEVLSESQENPDEGLAIGRAWFQAPEVDGSVVVRYDRSSESESEAVKTGRLVRVKIVSSGDVDLNGDFVCDSPLNAKISRKDDLKFAQDL
ncbi:MiaB/RimO family radical SAM methylthiotransferase [uncultured Treponema sp.]|uniref:MiaB/RimO family radical SAM methylthiotransferase n=1 Tax=uncultured Treponema sp. TaxID=162155 RepID=UPI0025FD4E3E|nr:MiaB/RimO family radical SAM methylthiotransferase [uncultured Treponema sp.]